MLRVRGISFIFVWVCAFITAAPAFSNEPMRATTALVAGGHDSQLLGVLNYQGGFVQRLTLALPAPTVVKNFKVQIPTFCKQVEVLEAGTVTEGVEDVAKQLGSTGNVYAVNGGSGERVSAVFATLNGPEGIACTIPIYTSDGTPGGDGTIEGSFGENGVQNLTIGPGNRITSSTYRITDLLSGYSAPIVFSSLLQGAGPRQFRVYGTWTDQFVLPNGQVVACSLPVYASLQYSVGYDSINMLLTYPRQIGATVYGCTYSSISEAHYLVRQ